jgi:hypothetical protein
MRYLTKAITLQEIHVWSSGHCAVHRWFADLRCPSPLPLSFHAGSLQQDAFS